MKGSSILIFDPTLDGCASDDHTSLPDNGNIHIKLKFDEAHAKAVTTLLYLKFGASIQLDSLLNVTTDFRYGHAREPCAP
jgi:hypothetical protein